jgi:hypothetical protein
MYNKKNKKIMKHILNNLSEEEKNAIREQHTGGMKVMTENFSKLLNSKLGDSKPLISEGPLGNAAKSALPSFKAEAVVEDDMMMEFPVVGIKISNGKYSMEIFDKTHNKNLVVYDFSGPIYDAKTKEQVYTDSFFENINSGNASKISSQYLIPITKA